MGRNGLRSLAFIILVLLIVTVMLLNIVQNGKAKSSEGTADVAVIAPEHPLSSQAQSCRQIVANPQLDVLEYGPGTGTAEPWFFLDPIIYFFKEGDGTGLAYHGYSLVLPDGDEGDPTPTSDILSQIVQFEHNLRSVTIAYQRAMLDPNPADQVYGELWQLTTEGEIDVGNPQAYRIYRWTVTDSKDAWAEEVVELPAVHFAKLNGQEIALLLRTVTDGGGASEADAEWVLFDDVTITACYEPASIFLPIVRRS